MDGQVGSKASGWQEAGTGCDGSHVRAGVRERVTAASFEQVGAQNWSGMGWTGISDQQVGGC